MTNSLPIPKGGRRKTRRWIQHAVDTMKKGAFTKQALHNNLTPEQFARRVRKHPAKFTLKTRRRAQFLRNVRRKV